jgi:hypothetical protein
MPNPFENIRTQAGEVDRSYQWYTSAVNKLAGNISSFSSASKTDLGELTTDLIPGNMYLFIYEAKYSDSLPYWDRVPLCMPFDVIPGGFSGLNLHYLPPLLRAQLLGKILEHTDKTLNEKSKIDISWSLLKDFGRFPEARPTVKKYLYNHVKSRFLKIDPTHWKASIFLPLQLFQKNTQQAVWKDSKSKL